MTQEQFFARYKYDVEDDLLGGGGFGKVYKAFDDTLNRYVAIKVSELKKGQESLSLMKEVELAASLPHHKNVAHYEECFRYKFHIGTFDYGILQYYPLGNLSQLVRSKKLQEADRESIATGIISGIHHLHGHNVVHRDLKSANILIAEGYQGEYVPKIADFGLSKQFTENEKSYFSNSFAGGSLLYVAPEQLEGKELRKNVDLWSLGVVLYELFVGETPFKASVDDGSETARAEIISKIKNASIPAAISTIPSKWQEVIRGCLVTDPTQRTKSIEDILSKMGMVSGNTSDTVVDVDPPTPKPKPFPKPAPSPVVPTPSLSIPTWVYYLIGGIALSVVVMLGIRGCGANTPSEMVVYEVDGLYGYQDAAGNVVIPARYKTASPFSSGRAKVTVADSVYYIDELGSIVELIKPEAHTDSTGLDTNLRETEKPNYDQNDEVAWQKAIKSNSKQAYQNYINDFPRGFYANVAKNILSEILKNETQKVSNKYDYKSEFSDGIAMVKLNDKWGYIDKTGREIIPIQYDNCDKFSEGIARVKLNYKWGYIDKTGREIIPIQYDEAHPLADGMIALELNRKTGYANKTGKVIIPFKYDGSQFFREGAAGVKLNGKWGFIDKTGREIIPLKYGEVEHFYNGMSGVKLNGKWGFIDKTGREIIPLKYDDCYAIGELGGVKLNGKLFYINKKGECVKDCHNAPSDHPRAN